MGNHGRRGTMAKEMTHEGEKADPRRRRRRRRRNMEWNIPSIHSERSSAHARLRIIS